MKLNKIVYALLRAILRFNARVYGKGSSHELCRDLAGEFSQELISVPCGRCSEVNLVLNPLAPWFCKRCHHGHNRTGVTPVPVPICGECDDTGAVVGAYGEEMVPCPRCRP